MLSEGRLNPAGSNDEISAVLILLGEADVSVDLPLPTLDELLEGFTGSSPCISAVDSVVVVMPFFGVKVPRGLKPGGNNPVSSSN